jgi:hypothetical protein
LRICFAGDKADAFIPWDRMKLRINEGHDEAGGLVVKEEPLSCEILDISGLENGEHAFTLNFKDELWEVTAGRDLGLDMPHYLQTDETRVKCLDEGNRSFSLHFACGEK